MLPNEAVERWLRTHFPLRTGTKVVYLRDDGLLEEGKEFTVKSIEVAFGGLSREYTTFVSFEETGLNEYSLSGFLPSEAAAFVRGVLIDFKKLSEAQKQEIEKFIVGRAP